MIILLYGLVTLRLLRRHAWTLAAVTLLSTCGALLAKYALVGMAPHALVMHAGLVLVASQRGLQLSHAAERDLRTTLLKDRALEEHQALLARERDRSEVLLPAILPTAIVR